MVSYYSRVVVVVFFQCFKDFLGICFLDKSTLVLIWIALKNVN